MGLLQSCRGRSMETCRLPGGAQSSSVEAMSLLSWTVEAQAQLEAAAHLLKLLDSPAQVEDELQLSLLFSSPSLHPLTHLSLLWVQEAMSSAW